MARSDMALKLMLVAVVAFSLFLTNDSTAHGDQNFASDNFTFVYRITGNAALANTTTSTDPAFDPDLPNGVDCDDLSNFSSDIDEQPDFIHKLAC